MHHSQHIACGPRTFSVTESMCAMCQCWAIWPQVVDAGSSFTGKHHGDRGSGPGPEPRLPAASSSASYNGLGLRRGRARDEVSQRALRRCPPTPLNPWVHPSLPALAAAAGMPMRSPICSPHACLLPTFRLLDRGRIWGFAHCCGSAGAKELAASCSEPLRTIGVCPASPWQHWTVVAPADNHNALGSI